MVQSEVLPAASVARNATLFTPFGKAEPLLKPLIFTTEPPVQLSVNVALAYVATAVQSPGSVVLDWLGGQVIVGAWVSFTVMRNVHVLVRPTASVAFQVTVVMPFRKAEPLAKPLTKDTEPPAQLSVNVGFA